MTIYILTSTWLFIGVLCGIIVHRNTTNITRIQYIMELISAGLSGPVSLIFVIADLIENTHWFHEKL